MNDFNQPTRRQDEHTPSVTPPSGQQTRQTQHGSIERNPDAPAEPVAPEPSPDIVGDDNPDPERP